MQIDEKKKSPFAIWYRYVMRKWPAELDFFSMEIAMSFSFVQYVHYGL